MRKRTEKVEQLIAQIKILNSEGYKDAEIARKLNRSDSVINRYRNLILNLPTNHIKREYISEYDRIRGYIIRNVKFSAKRRKIDFDLKFEDLELPTHCPILNIELKYIKENCGNYFNHATLDRIDNSKGYIKGNVIILSRLANVMKNEADFNQLELFALNIQTLINSYKNQGALGSITDIFPSIKLRKFSLDS